MKLPRRQFLHLAAGAAALPAVSRIAWAQTYPTRPVRLIVGFAAGGGERHRRAADRTMAVGASRPAVRHREPAGCWYQYRHRGRRASTARRLYAPPGRLHERNQRHVLPEAQFQFHPRYRTGFEHHAAAPGHAGKSICSQPRRFPSSSITRRPIRVRSTCPRPGIGTISHLAGELFKMMAGVNLVHVPFGGNGPALTALLGGQVEVSVRLSSLVDRVHQNRQAARARGHQRNALGGAAGHSDRRRVCPRLRGERVVRRGRAKGHACRGHRQAQQGDQCGPCRPEVEGAARRLRRQVLALHRPISANFIADETEKWGKVIRAANIKAG